MIFSLDLGRAGGTQRERSTSEGKDICGTASPGRTLCRERPLLMLFEDVHWADPTTRELLDLAVGRLPEMRVLLVVTFRPDFHAPWTGHAGVTLITLSRLDRTEGAQLAGCWQPRCRRHCSTGSPCRPTACRCSSRN